LIIWHLQKRKPIFVPTILMSLISSIYIIDDDPIAVFGLVKILGRTFLDTQVHEYNNPSTALNDLKPNKTPVDLIFLDMNLPVLDAWQFIEELNNEYYKKIILISSAFRESDLKKASNNQFVLGTIEKPVYESALIAFIEKNLNYQHIDFERLKMQTHDDLDDQVNLLKISVTELKKDIEAIENGIKQNNQKDSQLYAHKIKYAFRLLLNENANNEMIQFEKMIMNEFQSEKMMNSYFKIRKIVNQSIVEINNNLKNQQK
jgi:CheY-like chemotaxis protein